MTSNSENDIFVNAAKKPKLLCSKSDEKKIDHCEVSNDLDFDKIMASMSTYSSINNIYTLCDDYINKTKLYQQRAKSKKPDYPSDWSDESETESFSSTQRSVRKRKSCRKSRRLSLKKTVTNKPVKVTQISESNTKTTPKKKGVRTKNITKSKSKLPQDVLSQPDLSDLLKYSSTNGIQNSIDTNTSNHVSESIDVMQTLVSKAGGRSRGLRSQGSRSQGSRGQGRGQSQSTTQYPTYSIGNTEEYHDKSEHIPLFSSKPEIKEEIIISDEDSYDVEEVTVHVNWQNFEVFKFNLRKFQNLKQIFDFFAKKENVTEKRLFFAYNDVVITSDDSPASIKYNITKFIEGGLISQDLIDLVKECTSIKPSGIQIKFQCQSFKRPYELTVQPNDKLSLAMIKCAGHFEKPLNNLKFEFDGEHIIGTKTAIELDLENGDCIDIRIIK